MRKRRFWITAEAAATVAPILTGALFCTAALHVPRRLGPIPPAVQTVAIVAGDGSRLSAWWLKPDAPNGNCVAVFHGIGDSRLGSMGFAPMFLKVGYSVLLPDSRGHGASEGRLVTYGLLEKYDAIGWAHWLRTAGCRQVYGLGESLGASVLIQAAELEPAFAAIVAECPFADLREAAEYRVRAMLPSLVAIPGAKIVVGSGMIYARLVDGLDFSKVSPVHSIASARSPILLIHGREDNRTPPSNSERLAAANRNNPLWLVPNAPHAGAASVAPAEFRERVLGWFSLAR